MFDRRVDSYNNRENIIVINIRQQSLLTTPHQSASA